MSEDKKDIETQIPKEEEKVPDTQKKKPNTNKEPQYPSLGVQIRKDGQEVVPWSLNPTSDFVNPYGLTLKRKKRKKSLNFEKPREGCAVLQPKVNEPFEPIPRRMTRKELVKRVEEDFRSTNVEELLKNKFDINFSIPDQSKLPLPFFDDKMYDIYPNDYWMKQAIDKDNGKFLKIPAKALIMDPKTKKGAWKKVLVVAYNDKSDTFSVELDGEEEKIIENMPKMYILFDSENPIIFCKRISEAMKLRQKSEEIIKYNYYLKKIPKFEVRELPKERATKIINKIKELKNFNYVEQFLNSEMNTVSKSYVFQLNKIMFDNLYFKEKSKDLCCLNLNIEAPQLPPIPKFGKEMLYEENKEFKYFELEKRFNVNTLLCKKNIIQTLYKIRTLICSMKHSLSLYKVKFNNTVRLDEFIKDEKKNIYDFKKMLDSEQIQVIKKLLQNLEYKEVPLLDSPDRKKAAANKKEAKESKIEENNELNGYKPVVEEPFLIDFMKNRPKETKQKIFVFTEDREREEKKQNLIKEINNLKTLTLIKKINIMFQDELYATVVNSLINYVEFFEKNIPIKTEIIKTNEVNNIYPDPLDITNRIKNITKSKMILSEGNAFNKITDDPDEDLNTTYETIEYETENRFFEDKKPIFNIILKYKDGQFGYHLQVEDYIIEIRKIFDEGLDKIQKIEQINFAKTKIYSTMKYFDMLKRYKGLKFKKKQNEPLKTSENKQKENINANISGSQKKDEDKNNKEGIQEIDPKEDINNIENKFNPKKEESYWLEDLYDRLEKCLLMGKEPLEQFGALFNQYKKDLDIEPEQYVKSLDEAATENGNAVHTLRDDIIKHQNLYEQIKKEIKETIQVSYFNVNCKDVRDTLLNKHAKIKELEISCLNKKSQEIKTSVFKQVEEMKSGITKQSKNIEELVEIEKYIEDVPNLLLNLKSDIDSCLEIYKILDEFFQKVQYIDLRTRFLLIQSTTDVTNTISMAKSSLKKNRDKFLNALLESQATLNEDIKGLKNQINKLMTYKSIDQLEEAASLSNNCQKILQDCQERAKVCNSREVNFNREQTDFSMLQNMAKEFNPFYLIWTSIDTFQKKTEEFKNIPLNKLNGLDVEEMNDAVKKHLFQSIKILKEMEGFNDLIKTAENFREKSIEFEKTAELAVALTTQGLQDRHWNELKEKTGIDCTDQSAQIDLKLILERNDLNKEIIENAKLIADKASREFQIKQKLELLEKNWASVEFGTQPHRIKGLFIITGWGDIYKVLDEDVQEVQQLEVNPYKQHFINEINEWSSSFQNITDVLESLSKLQTKWFQLQPIFESPDITKSIPHDASIFAKADKSFKEIVRGLKESTNVKFICNKEGLLDKIKEANNWLEEVEKGLNDYIEKKKTLFPRFYFLSNETLLKILSETKDLNRVKENLKNIFENIHNIELQDDKIILKMISNLGEKVPLKNIISIERKNIEDWMKELQNSMFETVKQCMERCLRAYQRPPTKEWIFGHTGQSVIHSNQCMWTQQVEDAIAKKTIPSYCNEIQERINLLVRILREPLSRVDGITVFNLLTLEVHNKQITELFQIGEWSPTSFEWKKQLRYYWENDNMYVKSIQTSFPYGYEYLGNTEILVITPLTDKCYLTLMGAIKFNMGGAPAGPAGTGKTESTKDLAKSIAKQCVVYNCSEETDFVAVAAFFKGLANCGSWICFDEFNRINIEVLSVIASQLIVLFSAKAAGMDKIIFEKTPIHILPTFCVFITMNPDYEGRTALPDNLVALFRPMAMMVPDYKLISEVYLYSSGYLQAKDLAKKIVSIFKLSSEQLSSQSHYDFGMRAVKSVLYSAKKLKRANPEEPEDKLLLRAIRDVNSPKFLKEDIPLFMNIIEDLFPNTEKPKNDLDDLMEKIHANIKKNKLQPHPNFVEKIVQLYDTIQVRHGLMIVGPTGGGKSSNWKILQQSISDLNDGQKYFTTKSTVVNPKSVRKPELYCDKDPMNPTEWINGIIPILVNELNKDTTGKTKYWILFDGPVDTFWIEDMNSVLDDSRRLCLPSSAIIVLNETITMMFEVEDLVHASPATVSRCGMVYMEPSAVGLIPHAKKWMETKLPQSIVNSPEDANVYQRIENLFEMCLEENINYIRKHIKEPCPTTDINLAYSLFSLLDCFLARFKETSNLKISKIELEVLYKSIYNIYFFCTVWSIGITSREDGREKFNEYLREFMQNNLPEYDVGRVLFPEQGTVYDYYFDYENDEWKSWDNLLTYPKIDSRAEFTDIIIPTIDSVRYCYILRYLLTQRKHIITTGPTGTGKTVNMLDIIGVMEEATKRNEEKYAHIIINFSAQTTAAQTQHSIERILKRKGRGKYAPDNNRIMIVFVDDLNMPKKEKYEAQPPIEILRQWLDYEGWYDLNEKEKPFMHISNLIFSGAMGPPGGGRSQLTNRFMRHFNVITYTELVDSSIKSIFSRKVKNFLTKFSPDTKAVVDTLVDSTLKLYKIIKSKLLPIPKSSHYLFNLRDMSKVLQGVCGASIKHCTKKVDMVKIWMHEMIRSFGDRLICDEDRNWLKEILHNEILNTKDYEVTDISQIYKGLEKIIYCDFCAGMDRPYIQVTDIKGFITRVEDKLKEFNEEFKNKQMPLVMFLDACDHVARISRIIRQTGGHALLLGVGGSGRQSLARLSSYINFGMDCTTIEVIKGYRLPDFRKDVKNFLKDTVCKEKGKINYCFLLCDTQLFDEIMLEDMNNVLNSGDIPDIYKAEDYEEIKKAVQQEMKSKHLQDNRENMMSIYVKRVMAKIHIILAMSPVGEKFVTRLRMFPSLVNCCTIDWFTEWPEEALMSVAKNILEQKDDIALGKQLDGVIECIKYIHKSVEKISTKYLAELRRYNYLTPTSFLEFLSLFHNILVKKTQENQNNIDRYEMGLKVLDFAETKISEIEKEIQKNTPILEKLSKETEEIIKDVEIKKAEADKVREKASADSQVAEALAIKISKIEADCQRELSEAEKGLQSSLEKIDQIKDNELQELAGYKIYGEKLKMTLELLFTFKHGDKWRTNKANIKEPTGDVKNPFRLSYKEAAINELQVNDPKVFKEYFYSFKNEERREELKTKELDNVLKAEKYIEEHNMDRDLVDNASKAVGPCFDFIVGMIEFCHKSIEIVDPKKKEAAKAKIEKDKADEKLAIAQAALAKAEKESNDLETLLNQKQKSKNELIVTLNDNQTKVKRAKKIVELLAGEKIRWGESVKKLQDYSNYITGDCLIAAAAIAYSGPFVSTYRITLLNEWKEKLDIQKITRSENVSLRYVLEDPITTGKWNKNMLPNDNLSIENGIIMFKTSKWPLMIDPQNQASIFLKKYGFDVKSTSFQCIKISDAKMMDTVISGVKYGSWIMLDNVGIEIDNSLEPILQRQQVKTKSNFYEIKIGEKTITYNEEFKLFMVTTLSNPHYSPETFAKITIINFAITQIGLEDQMLSELVRIEMPQLEASKAQILEENFESKETLSKIEDQILDNLSKNKDNIEECLKNSELIDILTDSKKTSTQINEKLKISEKTEKEIDEKREIYRPSAKRASLLFFSLIDLAMIDPMYQFSLIQFKELYQTTIKKLPVNEDNDQRLKDIDEATTKSSFDFTCRALFERDKPLFSFLMTIKIIMGEQTNEDKIKSTELRFLLAGPSSEIQVEPPENPTKWISPNDWNSFYNQLHGMTYLCDAFKGIDNDFMKNHDKFLPFFESPQNEHTSLPAPYENTLTDFQKLILIKAIRFDKLTNELNYYVGKNLGKEYTEPPSFNLLKSFEDSTNKIPLLFVLSTGSDPKNDFQQLADSMGRKVEFVSLGKSMDKVAISKIDDTKLKGGWILLQNCHLAISFMPKLEDEIEKLQNSPTLDTNFRLWLTSMSSNKFSINVLKNSIKITMEPPKGLKLNLQRQYDNLNEEELEACSKPELFKSFFFSLCFFHAIVQDRRKFGPVGWNVKYDFTNEDLKVSRMQLKNFLEEYDEVPYKVLNYLVAEINYGGRVTDDKDQRLIQTILLTYLTDKTLQYNAYPYSESGIYYCPKPGPKSTYTDYIKKLPTTTGPEVFGLHDNAEIITAQNEARLLLETLLLMQPRTSSGSGKTMEQSVSETLEIIEKNTPPVFDYEAIKNKFPTDYNESMNTVLIQEVIRYNVLLNLMKVNIQNLKKALSGHIVMDEALDAIVTSIYNNQVPQVWIKSGFLSMKPLMSWIKDLNERITFFNDWHEKGTPTCFCISRFSFPQAFLTGTLQNYARKHKCEIDLLTFEFKIMDDTTWDKVQDKPEDGCYVYGMFLEGARWNYETHLLDNSLNRELYTDVPLIHMIPVPNREPPKTGIYNTPLYKVLSRQGTLSTTGHSTNFVLMVELPTKEDEAKWIKAGVAMFLALKQ